MILEVSLVYVKVATTLWATSKNFEKSGFPNNLRRKTLTGYRKSNGAASGQCYATWSKLGTLTVHGKD